MRRLDKQTEAGLWCIIPSRTVETEAAYVPVWAVAFPRTRHRRDLTEQMGRLIVARFRALHTAVLKPESDVDDFVSFMAGEFLPVTRSLRGCVGAELLRAYRGSLPGVASAKPDFAWITLWESVEANNDAWSHDDVHDTPDPLKGPLATLYNFAATVTLVGGFTVEHEI